MANVDGVKIKIKVRKEFFAALVIYLRRRKIIVFWMWPQSRNLKLRELRDCDCTFIRWRWWWCQLWRWQMTGMLKQPGDGVKAAPLPGKLWFHLPSTAAHRKKGSFSRGSGHNMCERGDSGSHGGRWGEFEFKGHPAWDKSRVTVTMMIVTMVVGLIDCYPAQFDW